MYMSRNTLHHELQLPDGYGQSNLVLVELVAHNSIVRVADVT